MAKQLNVNLAVTANTQQAKQQLQQLQQTLSSLTTNSANLKIGLDQTQLQQASKQLLELQAHLKAATNVDTGALDFTKLNNSIRNSGKTLTQYGQQLLALGPQGKEAFAQLAQSVAQSEVPIRRLSGLLGQFGTVLKNTIRWQISSSLIHGFMGSIQQAYGYAQDLNKSLNNIQIVTGLSDNQMAKFAKTANTAAKALSTTTTKYTDAALIYYQQGIRNEKEIADRTNATIKMANVTGQTAETVSNQMTAIWNNFADGSKNLEYYADVITALGAATASSSEEISQGLQKFAAVADTVGLSYENATAALATITATTRQSADTVGTGLRTLFSRLQSLSLGETLEDGVNLTKYSAALQKVGVNALDTSGQLRSMDEVINDLGNKWKTLSSAQQVALAQTVGGVRQYTTLVALMDNFDFYKQNLDVAKNSEGTLQKQQAIYEKSWEASSKRVKAAAETIYSSLLNDQFFIKLNNGFAGFLEILNQIISGLGGMKGILLSVGAIMTKTFSGQIAQGMYNFGTGIRNLFRTPKQQRDAREQFILDAGNLMAGGKYDAATGKVSTPPKGTNNINQASIYQAQLRAQANYVKNEAFMSPHQKSMFEAASANFDAARNEQQQAMLAYQNAQNQHQNALSNFRSIYGDFEEQTNFESQMKQIVHNHQQNEKLIDAVANAGYENLTEKTKEAFKTAFNFSDDNFEEYLKENFNDAIKQARQASNDEFVRERDRFAQGDRSMSAVMNTLDAEQSANRRRSKGDAAYYRAAQNYQDLSKQTSLGMKIAKGSTDFASAVMSAFATTQGIESFTSTIAKAQAGLISTKDAAIQCGAAIGQIAMNGVRTFTSFISVLGPVAGSIMAIATIALPYILDLVDNLHTSPEELLENLAAGTERAQQSAEAAKTAYDNLINGFSSHSSLLDTLSELTEGTLEFQQALLDANIAAYKLINDNKLSPDDWFIDERGAVQIKPEAYERLRQEAIQKQREENVYQYAARSIESNTQVAQLAQGASEASEKILNTQLSEAKTAAETYYTSTVKPLEELADVNKYIHDAQTINRRIQEKNAQIISNKQKINNELMPQLETANSVNLPNNATPGQWTIDSILNSEYGIFVQDALGFKPSDGQWFNAIKRERGGYDEAWKFIMEYGGGNLIPLAVSGGTYGSNFRTVSPDIIAQYPDADTDYTQFRNLIQAWIDSNNNSGPNTPNGDKIQAQIDALNEENRILRDETIPQLEADKEQLRIDYETNQTKLTTAQTEYAALTAQANEATFKPDYNDQRWIDAMTSWSEANGLDPTLVMAGIQAGTLYHDLSIDRGAATDNMIALQNARLLETGQEKLSQSEQLIIQGLSTSKALQEAITASGENLEFYEQSAADIRQMAKNDLSQPTEEAVQDVIDNRIATEVKNLSNDEIARLTLDQVKKMYLQNAPNQEAAAQELNDILESEQFTELAGDTAAQKRLIAEKLYQKRSTEAMQKAINDAYEGLGEERRTQLDNIKNLTITEIGELAKNLAADQNEQVAAIAEPVANFGNEILNKFLTAAQSTFDGLNSPEYEKFKENTQNLTLQEQEDVTNLRTQFANIYGDKTANLVFQKTAEDLAKGSQTIKNIFTDFQSTGSIIADLANIKAGTTSLGTTQLATDFYNSIKQDISEKGLFEELYNSEDFAEGLKSLRKELKKTGKIGADSLVALADQSELLSNYLEVSGANVQGLADALNLLETGKIDEMSSALLTALSAAGAVNSNLAQTYSYIDNFKEERSIQDIGAFMKKRADAVQAGFTSGMLLDAPLLQSMEALFGSDIRSQYQKDIYEWTNDQDLTPEQISKKVNENYEAQITAMKSIQERGNLSGMFEYLLNPQNTNGFDFSNLFTYNKQTGQVVASAITGKQPWELPTYLTDQDAFIAYLAQNGGISEDMARAMASEYAATNGFIAQTWRTTAANKGITALTTTAKDEVLTGDEVRAFYNQYKDVLTDYTEDSFLKKIAADAEKAGKAFIDLGKNFDVTTASIQQFKDAYEKNNRGKTFTQYLGLEFGEDGKLSNLEAATKRLTNLGMTAAQAYETINDELGETDEARLEKLVPKADQADFSTFRQEHAEITTLTEAWVEYQTAKQEAAKKEEVAKEQAAIIQSAIEGAITTLSEKEVQLKTKVIEVDATAITGKTYDVKVHLVPINTLKASGYNNTGFAGGKHSNGQYEGMATVGELGPELWIHDGQPYLAGVHGRTKAYIHPNDQIYTATQTQKILKDNPSLQDIPGFSVGYNTISWGTPSNADTSKNSTQEPERYHLITRQIKDLEREYDRLSKIKDQAYGTNKLEAINAEIKATQTLIEGQQALIDSTKTYLQRDTEKLKSLLAPGEFELDEFGNIKNYDELQEKYKKKAKEDKDEEAQKVWDALEQYELTVDKFNEANTHMQELIYQQMDLRLETITTKVDMKVNFDEREIKLLDHYIDRIDDNIYHTAEVLALTNQKLGNINQKINDTKEGIAGLFEELSDSEGNLIRKEDGSAYTMEEWLALSNEQRDMLNMNGKFGEQLEEYMDSLLDYIEELEKFKTKGVEEFGEAFSELNENVRSSIDLFDHYNQLLSNLKNIVDLQGVKLSAEMKEAMREIDAAMFSNTQNNIDAERENYKRLNSEVTDLRKKIAETQDETLKKQWEEQLKTAEEQLRTSESNMLSLWETGLQQAKDMFETALDDAATEYESTIAGMYGTVDELQKAWDQQKRNSEFYVKDFEKYYQISKLQRSITADLASQQKNGFKQSEGLKKLQDELNAARDSGVKLSSYDLDIYSKRYEYEKALMDLEDSRNAKSQVRLQRDANGNWGYVYTNNADEDDIIAKQQAVDDKLYELQKATQDRIANINDEMMSEITGVGQRLKELRSSGASQETIDKYLEQEKEYLNLYRQGLNKALEDAGMTVEDAKLRYGEEGFDILDQFQETLLSSITGNGDLDEFFNNVLNAMGTADSAMNAAGKEYSNNLDAINKWFNESGEDLATVIKGFASIINSESDTNLIDSKEQIQNAKDTFDEILQVATDFEKEFIKIYQPIIDENERLVGDLLAALHALNSEEYEGPNYSTGTSIADIIGDTATGIVEASHSSNKPNTKIKKTKKPLPLHTPKTETLEDLTERLKTTLFKPWSKVQIAKLDTGGYTGAWGDDGRLAILHEKEEVFNKDDTLRLLNAAEILRRIDLQANLMSKGISNFDAIDRGLMFNKANDLLEQMVTITAEFPNATNHSEIEEAFTNLINKASQYANRKGI